MRFSVGLLLAFAMIGLVKAGARTIPMVEFVDCGSQSFLANHVECLKITVPAADEESSNPIAQYAGMNNFRNSKNAFQGVLYSHNQDNNAWEEVPESVVSMSKHDGRAEVMIADKEIYEVTIDLSTGEVTLVDNGFGDGNFDEPLPNPEEDSRSLYDASPVTQRALPSQGFQMKLQILYDPAFAAKHGGNSSRINEAINGILTHAQTFFKKEASLTTKFILDIFPFEPINENLSADGANLVKLTNLVGGLSTPAANSYSLISYADQGRGGTIGIAWVGSTCSSYNTNINEYFVSDMRTAAIIVHEIGHNLGMRHDFNGRPGNPRVSSTGAACTNVGGFMDYLSVQDKWSPCSVEDFTAYYNFVESRGGWCMPLANSETTPAPLPTTPAPSTPAPTTPPPTTSAPTTPAPTTPPPTTPPPTTPPPTTPAPTTPAPTTPAPTTPAPTTPPPPTTTTTVKTTTEDPSSCRDTSDKCPAIKQTCGDPRRNGKIQQIVRVFCPFTCGLCKDECQNIWPDRRCTAKVVRRGFCSKNVLFGFYGQLVCKKACGLC